MNKLKLEELLDIESEQFAKLNGIVKEAIEEEKLLSQKLLEFEDKNPTFVSRVADRVASFGGSWKFILSFMLFMLVWILTNVYLLSKPFDQYPFILLNLLLSTIAALQAPVIMMSQNRKEEKDRKRSENDYLINLKAELEIRSLHQKMDLLLEEQLKAIYDIQLKQLELLKEIREDNKKK